MILSESPTQPCGMIFKTAVQTICAKFSKKYLCWSNFLIHLQAEGLQLHLKRSQTQVFSGEFCKDFEKGYSTALCGCFWNLSYRNKNLENSFIVLCLLCQNACRTKIRLSKKINEEVRRLYGLLYLLDLWLALFRDLNILPLEGQK